MTALGVRLPASLDPLITETKRRARNRRVLLVLVLVLALGGGGATLAVHPFGWLRNVPQYAGPYEPGGMAVSIGGPSPVVTGAAVQAVSAVSRSDAWVVGSVARRWDGSAWRNVPLPRRGEDTLWAVTTRAPDDAWAAGWRSDGAGPNYALIEHWNGVRWTIVPLPRLGQSVLYDVAAKGPRNAWAVGAAYVPRRVGRYRIAQPLLLHWNGSKWRRLSLPWSQNGLQLDKVIPTRRSSVWVVSRGEQDALPSRLEYWNGRRWRHVRDPFGTKDRIVGFSAIAGDDAWAVGSYALGGNEQAKYSHALAAHWNGRRWQVTPVPGPPGGNNSAALLDVSAVRADDVWALGEAQRLDLHDRWLSSTGPVGYFVHWDGRSWQVAAGVTPPIYEGYPAITAAPDGSAWAIGYCNVDDFSARWNGSAWVSAPHPRDNHWRTPVPARMRHRRPPTCVGESG